MRRFALALAVFAAWTAAAASPAAAVTAAWHVVTPPSATAGTLRAIASAPPAQVLVAGKAGAVWRSVDGGATWAKHSPATAANLNGIAFADLAHGVVVGTGGAIFCTSDGAATWHAATIAGAPAGDFFAVALNGNLGLAVGAAGLVAESTDHGATWTLDTPPVATALRAVAMAADGAAVAGGDGGALVARANAASGCAAIDVSPDSITACAVERTLSAGRTPLTSSVTSARVAYRRRFTLRGSVLIAAPGTLVLQRNYVGTKAWTTIARRSWSATTPSGVAFGVAPSANAGYRLAFACGGRTAAIGPVRSVKVRPLVLVKTTHLRVRRGVSYRISGSVRPVLRGRSVQFYTDRGGKWHRVSIGAFAKLRNGSTFVSRAFGTPTVQTYHLRVYLPADKHHLASWSATITVTVHR